MMRISKLHEDLIFSLSKYCQKTSHELNEILGLKSHESGNFQHTSSRRFFCFKDSEIPAKKPTTLE